MRVRFKTKLRELSGEIYWREKRALLSLTFDRGICDFWNSAWHPDVETLPSEACCESEKERMRLSVIANRVAEMVLTREPAFLLL